MWIGPRPDITYDVTCITYDRYALPCGLYDMGMGPRPAGISTMQPVLRRPAKASFATPVVTLLRKDDEKKDPGDKARVQGSIWVRRLA